LQSKLFSIPPKCTTQKECRDVVGCDPETGNGQSQKARVHTDFSSPVVIALVHLGLKKTNIKVIEVEGEYCWIEAILTTTQRRLAMQNPLVLPTPLFSAFDLIKV
jgi:hypothetical protein